MTAGTARADLGKELAAQLTAVPGVKRLEPSLRSTLRGMGRGGAVEVVPVKLRAEGADVAVDIATDGSRPAVAVAADVQQRVRSVLLAHDLVPGRIEVSVLTVEP